MVFPKKLSSSILPGLDIPARLWYSLPAFGETLLLELEQDPGVWVNGLTVQYLVQASEYVETLEVADDKMEAFYSAGLKHYLLTVMAAAAKAFNHLSICNPVSLVVLGPGEEGSQVGPRAAQTLHSFCAWQ
uniref:Uncharacterized protein n=1 Tax=Molossus molossus TaxID=27622 RepID=A0A7J8J6E1_MOLMO|nr:hypothetical protein HJG59_009627 [Molossus molossus]